MLRRVFKILIATPISSEHLCNFFPVPVCLRFQKAFETGLQLRAQFLRELPCFTVFGAGISVSTELLLLLPRQKS